MFTGRVSPVDDLSDPVLHSSPSGPLRIPYPRSRSFRRPPSPLLQPPVPQTSSVGNFSETRGRKIQAGKDLLLLGGWGSYGDDILVRVVLPSKTRGIKEKDISPTRPSLRHRCQERNGPPYLRTTDFPKKTPIPRYVNF